jgi:hypothetical protein
MGCVFVSILAIFDKFRIYSEPCRDKEGSQSQEATSVEYHKAEFLPVVHTFSHLIALLVCAENDR